MNGEMGKCLEVCVCVSACVCVCEGVQMMPETQWTWGRVSSAMNLPVMHTQVTCYCKSVDSLGYLVLRELD